MAPMAVAELARPGLFRCDLAHQHLHRQLFMGRRAHLEQRHPFHGVVLVHEQGAHDAPIARIVFHELVENAGRGFMAMLALGPFAALDDALQGPVCRRC